MKKYFILFILSVVSIVVNAQSINYDLQIVETEIKQAVKNQNYERAATLRKERAVYKRISRALKLKRYKHAASLKEELMTFDTYRSRRLRDLNQRLEAANEEANSHKTKEIEEEIKKIKDFERIALNPELNSEIEVVKKTPIKNSFDFDVMSGLTKFTYGDSRGENYADGFGADLRLSNRFYFGKNSTYRIGVHAVWLKGGFFTDTELTKFQVSPLNLGLTQILAISDNAAVELGATGGFSSLIDDSLEEYGLGHTVGGELKFKYKMIHLGIDYSYYHYKLDGIRKQWREPEVISSYYSGYEGRTIYNINTFDGSMRYIHKFSVVFGVRF